MTGLSTKMKFSGLRSVVIKIMIRITHFGYKIFKNMHNIFFLSDFSMKCLRPEYGIMYFKNNNQGQVSDI